MLLKYNVYLKFILCGGTMFRGNKIHSFPWPLKGDVCLFVYQNGPNMVAHISFKQTWMPDNAAPIFAEANSFLLQQQAEQSHQVLVCGDFRTCPYSAALGRKFPVELTKLMGNHCQQFPFIVLGASTSLQKSLNAVSSNMLFYDTYDMKKYWGDWLASAV